MYIKRYSSTEVEKKLSIILTIRYMILIKNKQTNKQTNKHTPLTNKLKRMFWMCHFLYEL